MGRPRADQNTTATPERLLDAAEAVFSAVGFRAAKLADIASQAGIRRPSLLYHFETKEALYAATVQRSFTRLREGLLGAMATQGDFETRLCATVSRYAEFLESHPAVARLVVRELLAGQGPGALVILDQVAPLLEIVQAFVQREGEGVIRAGLPVRAAVMQLASDVLMRAAAGPLRDALWGRQDHAPTMARLLFLPEWKP